MYGTEHKKPETHLRFFHLSRGVFLDLIVNNSTSPRQKEIKLTRPALGVFILGKLFE
jgi:hypothetical protein